MSRTLAFIGVTALINIGGQSYGLWHYRLSWSTPVEPASHLVQEGESLSSIAKKFLGDGRRWPEIFRLNRAMISNPNLIFPGQRLQLPSGVGLESQVGLGFSVLIDIRSPLDFPSVPELGSMSLQKLANADLQFISTALNQAHGNTLDFFLVAPSAVNSATTVILATKGDLATGWHDLAFQTPTEVPAVGVQGLIKGPAVMNSSSPGGTQPVPPTVDLTSTSAASPLENSAREILKGTLVPLAFSSLRTETNGLLKSTVMRQLALSKGETDAIEAHFTSQPLSRAEGSLRVAASTLKLFRSFERAPIPALRPNASAIAAIPAAELSSFANAVVQTRTLKVKAAHEAKLPAEKIGPLMQSLNSAVIAAQSLATNSAIQPLGMLNLERIEMVPAGLQRGELIATIPLAPGEETAVTHKEWSVTSKEFTTIVTDSLEQTSETGVTDNTDLSQSTTSQNQHSTQFNITGTVQGGIPMISGSSTAGVTAQDAGSQSATESIKHATATTQKASARSRQEHKTTISTTTVTGTSETSTRILKNSSLTDPIRIDYFSLMRKWRVRLYRFGLRLTYDVVIPEPAASMRRAYTELEMLRKQIHPFDLDFKYSDITNDFVDVNGNPTLSTNLPNQPKYLWLADRHGAAVRPHPTDPSPITADATNDGSKNVVKILLEFDVPSGTAIKQIFLDCNINFDTEGSGMKLLMMGTQFWPFTPLTDAGTPRVIAASHLPLFDAPGSSKPFLAGRTGHQKVYCLVNDGELIILQLTVELVNSPDVIENWRNDVWNALFNAAQSNYYANQQDIAARIRAIEDQLANVDTLTLRREESDEIMKGVLKWALGVDFDFMPDEVQQAFKAGAFDLSHGIAFDAQKLGVTTDQSRVVQRNEDLVRFINQAIEWENVVTFLYSYFWDVPESWSFIRGLRHADLTRQAFLRAGSARVVLTIRKGWESRWERFTQDLTINAEETGPPNLSIAQEIAAYDDRNYPGIPPANPAKAAVRLQDAVFTTSSSRVEASNGRVNIPVSSSAGFVVGLNIVLDVADNTNIQEAALVTEIPDANHIIVDKLVHAHDGTDQPFPVLQPGEKGTLVAEWFEYTPSSGTDIAVTSNLTTIA